MPEGELELIAVAADGFMRQTAECFWLFRCLHRMATPDAVLMGDYCFGRFSAHLAAIDSVELTNAFAAFLKKDSLSPSGIDEYINFLKTAPRTN